MRRGLPLAAGLFAGWLSLASAQESPRFEVNFQNAELTEFIDSVSRITGRTFIVDPRVRGSLSVRGTAPLTANEVYAMFLSQLRANGYAAVELEDGRVKVLPDQAARMEPLPVEMGEGNSQASADTIATRVFSVRNGNTEQLLGIIKPLVDPRVGVITPYPSSNLLVVTDWRSNLSRIGQLVKRLDNVSDEPVETLPLRYAQAKETSGLIEKMLASRGQGGKQGQILADERSNSLIVRGDESTRREVRRLLAQLDVSREQASNTEVVYLHHAKAEEVIKVLRGLSGDVSLDNSAEVPIDSPLPTPGGAVAAEPTVETTRTSTVRTGDSLRLEADTGTNAIVMVGPPSEIQSYRRIIEQLDIRRAQVVVEAIIAEISDTKANELGVQWLFLDRDGNIPAGSVNFTTGTPINSIAAAAAANDINTLGGLLGAAQGITAGVGRISGSGINFIALLQAMRSESGFNLLSTPTLLTLDNAEASIMVGQEVPFLTGSITSNNANPYQTIERREVGVKLRLKPQINEGNTVRMEIVQEVSSIADDASASDVITNKREIKTTVMVEDNGLVVLGGLISDEGRDSAQRVPLLGDVPVLGNLFRANARSRSKQNLLVFIRPRILRDPMLLQQVSEEKYKDMRESFPGRVPAMNEALSPSSPVTLRSLYPSSRARLEGLQP
ncbi:type II secretion system secretin GspD [Pseudomonas matsuisoli]|uniref:Type II secretion system protein GspD n=1 Tax=Pseudomonas matsuisoli TaxID=1515666 RepID=A0A917V195_9PSED|nr:type II secretion system protein GspD [Pseudomonas matsuisoli]